MKKITLFLLMVLIASGLLASGKETGSFVVVGDETYYCTEVQLGKINTNICIDGQQEMKVPTRFIKAYTKGSKLYEYLPVLNLQQDTTGWAFMQFLASKNGNRLYLYCSNCLKYDPVYGIIAPSMPVYRFYVFKHGRFVSVTDDFNENETLADFGVKIKV